eukprot:5855501-Amphidinium_carterae.1
MSVVSEIECVAKASASFDASGRDRCFVLVEEGKLFLQQSVEGLIEEHSCAPLCFQFSADSTPIKVRTYTSLSGPTKKQRSSGEASTDFFVMQVFVGVATGDETVLERVVFCDPVQLRHGKTMASLSACVEQFMNVHDRGMSKSFREATVGHFITNCGLSDEMAGLGSTDTLKRLHIGIGWLVEVLCPISSSNAQPVSVLTELYEAFGMESTLLALVCEEMRLYWCFESNQLQILDTFMSSQHAIEKLSGALQSIWRFPAFCSS